MARALGMLVAWVSRVHNYILTLNDRFEYSFSDKELHFLVIGAIGLGLILLVYPVFRLLANHNRVLAITWIYVLTVLLVLTFAIEIGQRLTGSGTMDFSDVVAGMGGFFAVTAVIVALHIMLWMARSLVSLIRRRQRERRGVRA
jgi:hypothetical protein